VYNSELPARLFDHSGYGSHHTNPAAACSTSLHNFSRTSGERPLHHSALEFGYIPTVNKLFDPAWILRGISKHCSLSQMSPAPSDEATSPLHKGVPSSSPPHDDTISNNEQANASHPEPGSREQILSYVSYICFALSDACTRLMFPIEE
jgi:hypothetical protein